MDTIPTAFDDLLGDHNEYEKRLLSRIKEFGWQSTHVFDPAEGKPSFTYSTGFWKTLGRPEVIVFDLPSRLAHDVLWKIYTLSSDNVDIQMEEPVTGILSGESVYFFAVREDVNTEYLPSSQWFYKGKQFPTTQMVWADQSGNFPWQPGFDRKLLGLQPDISKAGWPSWL